MIIHLLYTTSTLVYKTFIYEKEQSYTVVENACQTTHVYKNSLCIANFKQTNKMEPKQQKYYTNDIKCCVAHKHILIHSK